MSTPLQIHLPANLQLYIASTFSAFEEKIQNIKNVPHLCFEQAQPKNLAWQTPMKAKTKLALQSWKLLYLAWPRLCAAVVSHLRPLAKWLRP